MGITYVNAVVTGPTGKQESLELLVDSGAILLVAAGRRLEGD